MDQYSSVVFCTLFTYIIIANLSYFEIDFKEIIIAVILTLIASTISFEIKYYLKMLPMLIGGGLYIYINTKKVLHSIAYSLTSMILLIIVDYALCALYYMLFNINGVSLEFTFKFMAVELIVMFLVSKVLGKLLKKANLKIIDVLFNSKFLILMTVALVLILIKVYTSLTIKDIDGTYINAFLFFILCILIIIIVYIMFRFTTKEAELKSKQINFEVLQNYTTKIEGMYSDMRSFKHDYANIISSMIGYIDEEDMAGLKKHFYENILPLNKKIGKNDSEIGRLRQIKVPEVKGLLSLKLIRAQEMGIEVFIDIKEPIEQISMNIIDLTRVLGILLDNAIEATEECALPKIKIGFIKDNHSLIIVICNRYKGDAPSVDKLYKKGYSTKGANRGIGLTSLREIINKYETIYLDTLIEDGEFVQTITLDKNFKHSH